MAGNSFGRLLRLTTFGESHGPSIGGILDGVPAGLPLSEDAIQKELDLRKPGVGITATTRKETDTVHIQSGVFEGKTTGTSLAFVIYNSNQHSADYDSLARVFRPGHADWTYWKKYNGIRDYRGGGRSSGRETAARVAAGAIANLLLDSAGIHIYAGSIALGPIRISEEECDLIHAIQRPYFAASDSVIERWDRLVDETRKAHDTLGGIVQIEAHNVPAGLGDPVFDKISAWLAHGLMSVGAVKGVEIGDGFAASKNRGSDNNDTMMPPDPGSSSPRFSSNHAGGILGGITSGQNIVVRCAVKPIASISKPQNTIDIDGNPREICIQGRHDLSAIPRIVPVLKAMTALVLCDAWLIQKANAL
ncbi:MAG: chorismate synthase [Desulfovibrio sp.]|nr:chorismate synthase [Desulfovibrio sp.]